MKQPYTYKLTEEQLQTIMIKAMKEGYLFSCCRFNAETVADPNFDQYQTGEAHQLADDFCGRKTDDEGNYI